MNEKLKINKRYKLLSILILIVSLVGIIFYFLNIYFILFICIAIVFILILIWGFMSRRTNENDFDNKSVSKEGIENFRKDEKNL